MKTMTKQILSFILVLATLTGLLAGCGGGPETPVTEATQAAVQTAPAATEPAATEPAATEPAPVAEPASLPVYEGTPEVIRAKRLGLIPESWQDDLSREADFEGFDQLVTSFILFCDQSAVPEWQELVDASKYPDRVMRRDDGLLLLFLLSEVLGYNVYNSRDDAFSTEYKVDYDQMFKQRSYDYPYCDDERQTYIWFEEGKKDPVGEPSLTAIFWFLRRMDRTQQKNFFDHDGSYNYHLDEPLTREAAVNAIIRLYNSVEDSYNLVEKLERKKIVSIDDPIVSEYSVALTEERIAKAQQNPVVTAEDHPRWTGFVLGETHTHDTFVEEIATVAEWDFNSVRYKMRYSTFFNEDITEVDMLKLWKLDQMVASAIENDVHLNLCLCELPGRWTYIDEKTYKEKGEFDLFTNAKHQENADKVFRFLAERYKDVPNFNLSITPFFEPTSKNMSTGLKGAKYTEKDVATYLGHVIDLIREESPDRLIIYEPTGANPIEEIVKEATPIKRAAEKKGNVIINYNACETAYAYASMGHSDGGNIDDMNHSMFIPQYPSYIYNMIGHIKGQNALTLDGVLPAGTKFDIYMRKTGAGTLKVEADGNKIHSESLRDKKYKTSNILSDWYPFATSKGVISFTLKEDVTELVLSCSSGFVDLAGICVTLPEEYAKPRWYYAQPYDVFLGKETKEGAMQVNNAEILLCPMDYIYDYADHVTIHEDLTYTTNHLAAEASLETIQTWAKQINEFDGNCVVRFERADMGGVIQGDMEEYYTDLLKTFEEYGYSWWSNDWLAMTDRYAQEKKTAECESVEYGGYRHFNYDTLEVLWKYRSKD